MSVLNDLTLGQYQQGDSFLHRLDPRLKLAGALLLVVAVFSGSHALRLLVLGAAALVLVLLSGVSPRRWWRGLRALRYLFFFTVVLHLFFSPGRTLLGVEWLSYDGLLRGLVVCFQMGLALVFSSLLTFTTRAEEIAAAFHRLCAPLSRLRVPVEEGGRLALLILHFIPILREEASTVVAARRDGGVPGAVRGRIGTLKATIPPLVLRLVDRADDLAHACARGEKIPGEQISLPPLRAAGVLSMVGFGAVTLLLIILLP